MLPKCIQRQRVRYRAPLRYAPWRLYKWRRWYRSLTIKLDIIGSPFVPAADSFMQRGIRHRTGISALSLCVYSRLSLFLV
jgi:hypothetical protein